MGVALIKIKIMPSSLEASLEKIKENSKEIIEHGKGRNCNFEEEPIAFGLKAVIASFEIDEDQELEPIEENLRKIDDVTSADVADMRRAFG